MLSLNTWQVLSLLAAIIGALCLVYFLGVEVGRAERDGTRIEIG